MTSRFSKTSSALAGHYSIRYRPGWLLPLVLLMLTKPTSAMATEICKAEPECERHLEQGGSLYDREEYSGALSEYLIVLAQTHHPQMLLTIGRTYQKLCKLDDARDYYDRFRQADPNPDPVVVEKLNRYDRELTVASHCALPTVSHPAKANPAATTQPIYKKAWFWIIIGGSAAIGLGLGLGLGLHPAASEPFVTAHPVPTE